MAVQRMPVLFVGHGSPMNAIEENTFTRTWEEVGERIPVPKAILAISAHWYTHGTRITDVEKPKMVYDMYGFPEELYQLKYEPPGSPDLAQKVRRLVQREVQVDNTWGLDHGAWSVLCRMFPGADIPVVQLSVDMDADPQVQFQIGKELASLRKEGVLIFGSGNVVHNLGRIDWQMRGGFPWAEEFDAYIRNHVQKGSFEHILNLKKAGENARYAFVTPEHFYPLLYALGASGLDDRLTVFNEACTLGSLSMTSYLFEDVLPSALS